MPWPKAVKGKNTVYFNLHLIVYHQWKPRQELKAEAVEKGYLLACSAYVFTWPAQWTGPSLVNKMPHRKKKMHHRPIWWRHFLVCGSVVPYDSSLCQDDRELAQCPKEIWVACVFHGWGAGRRKKVTDASCITQSCQDLLLGLTKPSPEGDNHALPPGITQDVRYRKEGPPTFI